MKKRSLALSLSTTFLTCAMSAATFAQQLPALQCRLSTLQDVPSPEIPTQCNKAGCPVPPVFDGGGTSLKQYGYGDADITRYATSNMLGRVDFSIAFPDLRAGVATLPSNTTTLSVRMYNSDVYSSPSSVLKANIVASKNVTLVPGDKKPVLVSSSGSAPTAFTGPGGTTWGVRVESTDGSIFAVCKLPVDALK